MPGRNCHRGEACFYCDAPLSPRHEHDHMPVPQRHGGTEAVATCINCHDLKDRMDLRHWPVEDLFRGWREMPPVGRLLMSKVYANLLDLRRAAAEQESA